MLARYLARHNARPVRYAAQDALNNLRLAMALRNFLHIQTRSLNLPPLGDEAAEHLQHPALPGLLQDLFGRHDPRALAMTTDLLEDQTGRQDPLVRPEASNTPVDALSDTLHILLRTLQGGFPNFPQDRLRRIYGNLHDWRTSFLGSGYVPAGEATSEAEAERANRLHEAIRGSVDPMEASVYDLMRDLVAGAARQGGTARQEIDPLYAGLRQHRSGALGGQLPSLMHLYDALHAAHNSPILASGNEDLQGAAQRAGLIRDHLATDMRMNLLPALYEGQ